MFKSRIITSLFLTLLSSPAYSMSKIPECEFKKPSGTDLAEAKAVIEKLKKDCIPRIARVNACVVRSRLLMENVNELTKIFVTGSPAKPLMIEAAAKGSFDGSAVDLGLWNNFVALEKDYAASLDAVEAFVTRFKEKSDDNVKYEDFMAELDKGYNISSEILSALSMKESALLSYIEHASNALERSSDRTRPEIEWLASDACKDAEIGQVLALSKTAVEQIVERISTMRSFLIRARDAREHLIQYTYSAIRHEFEAKYREKAMQDLSTMGGKIEAILLANKLMVQFDLWTGAIARDNVRGVVEFTQLQFEASQRMRAIDLVTAQDFKERLLLVTEQFPEVATPYFSRLNSIISGMTKSLERIETEGWQGFLAKQKLLAEKRISMADRYPAECVALLRSFVDQIDSVQSIEAYRLSEAKYKDAVIACEVKP